MPEKETCEFKFQMCCAMYTPPPRLEKKFWKVYVSPKVDLSWAMTPQDWEKIFWKVYFSIGGFELYNVPHPGLEKYFGRYIFLKVDLSLVMYPPSQI